jgi:hypothetical protein
MGKEKEDLCDLYCRYEGTLIGLIENSMDISFYAFCYTYDAAIPYLQQTFTHSGCAMMCSAVLTPASPKLFSPLLVVLHLLSGG